MADRSLLVYASKDVILSAGALDSPKLLLLSGIGPAKELIEHQIPVIHDLPGVGKSLRDHCAVPLAVIQKPGTTDRPAFYSDASAMEAAKVQWHKDQTGPLSSFMNSSAIGFFKNSKVVNSEEFKALDKALQEYMLRDTVPQYEIYTVSAFQ